MSYLGRVKPVETTASVLRSTYTGDGTTTTYNLPNTVSDETAIIATINGVVQQDAAYTTNGSQILFSAAPASGDAIELRVVSGVGLGYAPPDGSVVTGKLADGAVTNGKIADGGVSAAKLAAGAARANFGAGAVLQVVNGMLTGAFNTTSATYVATGLTATITPTSSTSKVFILVSANTFSSQNGQAALALYKNGSNLNAGGLCAVYSSGGAIQASNGFSYVDAPASTSAQTYAVYIGNSNGTQALTFNSNAYSGQNMIATITLMEIAA